MDEALMKRVLPHSVEAEQSVIGSMLMDKDAIIAASEIITASDFYQQQYGIMFESMVELFNEGAPVDLITLQNRLKEKDVRVGADIGRGRHRGNDVAHKFQAADLRRNILLF